MEAKFGAYQSLTSKRLANYPALGKMISKLFGYTNVGNFARSLVFKRIMREVQGQRHPGNWQETCEVLRQHFGKGDLHQMGSIL